LKRLDALWIACGAGFVAYVVYQSVTPDPIRAPSVDDFKTGHILAYAWLMLWFAQVARKAAVRLATAALLCALGVALEYAQLATGYRHFAYSDMIDDAIGVGTGLALAWTRAGGLLDALRARASSPAR
jgi:VanZ family protein